MATSSWMIWGRNHRTSRSHRRRQGNEDSYVQLDLSRGLKENVKEVLCNLCQRENVSSLKKLAYLNAIVKLISENDSSDYGYPISDIFCCLRVGLVHEATQVRAAALRTVRYMLKKEQDVIAINKLQYPYFVARSMDLNLRNDMERMQALRLVRRILVLAPKHFSPVLARSLITLTNGGVEEKDGAFRVFLAALCELGVLNSNLLISCGGVSALARAAMTGQSAAIIEAVVGVLVHLLNTPETRSSISLLCFAVPYCELLCVGFCTLKGEGGKFSACKLALLSILRSYAGILHFCRPDNKLGLKAISDMLYVDQFEVRGAVLELFYELLDLPLPTWTDEPDVALAAVDPSRARDSWKLSEGFVAAEGKYILPSLSSRSPNITEIHLALLVYTLLECGLPRALAESIVSTDTFISVRAAVLLGALLHLAHSLLPSEVCDLSPPLPNLLEHASTGKHQALAAVRILERMHLMMRRRPAPASLFLDKIIQAGTWLKPTLPRRQRTAGRHWLRRESPTTHLLKDAQVLSSKDALAWNWPVVRSILRSRDETARILHDSDHRLFIKRLVRYFKPCSNGYSRVELATNANLAREATLAGCDLLNCLLETHEPEGTKLLLELVEDIHENISNIRTAQSAHECLFSPRHMATTCCQMYFLFLGQLSHSAKGTRILKEFNLLTKLQDLALTTNHDCYVKLIISSLDYSRDGPNQKVLAKIISDALLESTRLYATQFLRLILRARMVDTYQWAIVLLLGRLSDSSKVIALTALEVLHEACEELKYLEALLQQGDQSRHWDKWLEELGDKGYLLKIRLYSLRQGFTTLSSPSEELEKWISPGGFAERYVGLIEGEIHDSLTRRQRNETGCYHRRTSNMPMTPHDIYILPHLVGQLVQHDAGVQLLLRRNVIQRFARIVHRFRLEFGFVDAESSSRFIKTNRSATDDHGVSEESGTDEIESNRLETIIDSETLEGTDINHQQKVDSVIDVRRQTSLNDSRKSTPEKSWRLESDHRDDEAVDLNKRILKVKSALWALGHVGTAAAGVEQLKNLGIIELISSVAETCSYYVVRATAMYALSLIATTREGADALTNLDWPCVRHRRGNSWLIVPPSNRYPAPSPLPVQRHHRSLSDGKPELPEPVARRTRNRSESAATDLEAKRYALPERGETPSPVASIQRLSQQDAEGYARLRSLQRHRRPSYSQSSLEMYGSDGRVSLQSLSELDSSRNWITEHVLSPTPPLLNDSNDNLFYMGITLPKRLLSIFPELPQPSVSVTTLHEVPKSDMDTTEVDEEYCLECDVDTDHDRVCLICSHGKSSSNISNPEKDINIQRKILWHVQRLANPVWYRNSRQSLRRLKKAHAELFQDTCLFSDVAACLGTNTYRLAARRFLQELFLDSTFQALYEEAANVLKADDENYEKLIRSPSSAACKTDACMSSQSINGRLTSETQVVQLHAVIDEAGGDSKTAEQSNYTHEIVRAPERQSDEKIIAEILKPEERIRVSKSSDRLLKVSDTNTAMRLDS